MEVVTPRLVSGKKVLLRYDIDVALRTERNRSAQGKLVVGEEFKLKAGLDTLRLCLENAQSVIIMGHVGRPSFAEATEGKPDKFFVPKYSVAPIVEWFKNQGYQDQIDNGQLTILENLRFDPREESCDLEYAKELARLGDFFVMEAFSAYRPASSTTLLPTLLPHAAGLRFAQEIRVLTAVRDHPKKPFIAIMGGAKVKDKLAVIEVLAKKADAVLVGGKLVAEIRQHYIKLPNNVMVGKLNQDGFDIAAETTDSWRNLIAKAAQIVWNGPLGKFEDPKYNQTKKVAEIILDSQAEVVIGGGDSVAALSQYRLLEQAQQKAFVSVGGGAMLKLLGDGTLPTIEVLS